jgi:hypothetical protein
VYSKKRSFLDFHTRGESKRSAARCEGAGGPHAPFKEEAAAAGTIRILFWGKKSPTMSDYDGL